MRASLIRRAAAQPFRPSGKLTWNQLHTHIEKEEIDTVIVAFTDVTGRLLGKRYDAPFVQSQGDKFISHACDYLLTVDSEMNVVEGFKAANWEKGLGDFHLVPDMSTLCVATWLDKTALVLCDVQQKDHTLAAHAPRSILRKQVAEAEKLGFRALCASELEYYLYKESYESIHLQNYTTPKPAGWYLEDYHILQGTRTEPFHASFRRHLRKSGIPVETSKGEYGHGQHETNIEYTNILEMADRHVIFKQAAKEIAESKGMAVTFMAKPHQEQSGSSCHIHLSLTDTNGKPVFPGTDDFYGMKATDTFKHFLGGYLKYIPEVMPFLAPTINSYKRYVSASFAPTKFAWSPDNRAAGFRIVGEGPGLRIECRIPGADCNPYNAFAACLAAGMEGIKNKIEGPEPFIGDIYNAKGLPEVPPTLRDAVDILSKSSFARNAFGDDAIDHYVHFYNKEIESYNGAVTNWERRRYFEQI